MNGLDVLRPTEFRRVIDLVREAGVDISDWANFVGGAVKASVNPRYCYEWAFIEVGKVVVLNVWYSELRIAKEVVILDGKLKEMQDDAMGSSVRRKRALMFEKAVATACSRELPIRVILLDEIKVGNSRMMRRALDPVPWRVVRYDSSSGAYTLARGALPGMLVDQFDIGTDSDAPTETRSLSGVAYHRNPEVRAAVLKRADGFCEWCHQPGFATPAGAMFLETHHVIPLSEGGRDKTSNVVAICPNHHREAHYGAARDTMRERLLLIAGNQRRRRGS